MQTLEDRFVEMCRFVARSHGTLVEGWEGGGLEPEYVQPPCFVFEKIVWSWRVIIVSGRFDESLEVELKSIASNADFEKIVIISRNGNRLQWEGTWEKALDVVRKAAHEVIIENDLLERIRVVSNRDSDKEHKTITTGPRPFVRF